MILRVPRVSRSAFLSVRHVRLRPLPLSAFITLAHAVKITKLSEPDLISILTNSKHIIAFQFDDNAIFIHPDNFIRHLKRAALFHTQRVLRKLNPDLNL